MADLMKNTFEDYLKEDKTLTTDEMQRLHRALVDELGEDEDALELYGDLMKAAIRYANIRAKWTWMTREEKMDIDSLRTSCHNSVINGFNILARYLRSQGKEASWRDALGDEKLDGYCRKTIGDFACYLVFVDAVLAR